VENRKVIRRCDDRDFDEMLAIINNGAQAYRDVIPEDRWTEPYMPASELRNEIANGVVFWGCEENGLLAAVMGLQFVQDVALIRHAYTRSANQKRGIGARLLHSLQAQTDVPILVGTWADAVWAIRFYEKHGFRMVSPEMKARLLRKYWKIPERQVETSVVLADTKWWNAWRP
jgi:GNAT superfamily N-acetyltransferase